MSSNQHQAEYWDSVAGHIQASDSPNTALVGYHSPYDMHVRQVAVRLLDKMSPLIAKKECIAELGSGAGLNLRYFAREKPKKMLAFDCSSQLLAIAKSNLAGMDNVEFIHTGGSDLPVPRGVQIDLLFTVTVLQHITQPEMYRSVVAAMMDAKPRYILIIEDTHRKARQPTPDYTLRSPQEYIEAFGAYSLVACEFASLSWAARVFGVLNRLFGLYKRPEGSKLPKPFFMLTRFLSPVAGVFDALLPGEFGMTAALFRLK